MNETIEINEINNEEFKMENYSIQATEMDMRTISAIFGGELIEKFKSSEPFEQIDARIESLFATSHILYRLAVLNREALKGTNQIDKTLNNLALAYAKVAKDLLDKNDMVYEEGIFNDLKEEGLKPIIDILNNIEVTLPEGL